MFRARRLRLPVVLIVAVLVIAGAASDVAYHLGRSSVTVVTTRHGTAYTNATHQTAVTIDHWSYNVPPGVAWINQQGSYIDSPQPPSCLRPGTSSQITFGTVDVRSPGIRAVVWVHC